MTNRLGSLRRILTKLFGSRNERVLKGLGPVVGQINSFESGLRQLSAERLAAKTAEFRNRLTDGQTLDTLLPEAFAAVREAAFRNLRTAGGAPMRHFDVQLLGGLVLHQGKIAEMATGEGKTLVATLPAYLNSLSSRGVHIVTVNDYLAKRDRDWMSPVFEALGMRAGAIQSEMDNADRQFEYAADVTYGTNNEFGFDYLRDNMKVDLRQQVQRRGRIFGIVDEVDSILVDEARTPLIISGPAEQSTDKYYVANRVVKRLVKGQDFEVKEKERDIVFTEAGIEKAEKLVGVGSFYVGKDMEWPHLLSQALKSHFLYKRDVDYMVRKTEKGGEVVIIDEFTGRLMEGRTWSEGLHQAVEAKEGLSIRRENQTLATITLQNYFKLYEKLAGMTGTAMTEAVEFFNIYGLEVVTIPTNKAVLRADSADVIYCTARDKFNAIVEEIVEVNQSERPILVGTTSVERSEMLSGMLKRRGVEHHVLNAKQHQREAEIVALAGQPARVTISTNMAGRGTDIVLGPGIAEKGGLHVVGSERHEARRIDNQLRGRCARQGDPGSSKFFLSLEDDLMRRFASDRVSAILKRLGMREGEEISHPWVTRSIARAQKKVELYHFDVRKRLLEYDGVMNEQRIIVYSQRQSVLEGEDLRRMVLDMAGEALGAKVRFYLSQDFNPRRVEDGEEAQLHPVEELRRWLRGTYGLALEELDLIAEERVQRLDPEPFVAAAVRAFEQRYVAKEAEIGSDAMRRVERFIMLLELDERWKDHLHAMDELRQSIGMRSYGQIDPKVAYKQEGYQMFQEMIENLRASVTQLVLRVRVREEDERTLQSDSNLAQTQYVQGVSGADGGQPQSPMAAASEPQPVGPVKPFVRKDAKVGRNDPCACGSGKKFKKCCGAGAGLD